MHPSASALSRQAGLRSDVIAAVRIFKRPQPVTVPMLLLFSLIPFYLVIGWVLIPGRTLYMPELALDHAIPVTPAWTTVYLSLLLAAVLPVFVVHQQELIRRTINAFLMIWLTAFVFFIAYPTTGPQPGEVAGNGFFAWSLRALYGADVRYNCFPSLHVAQCFLAALVCHRVHRGVGYAAGVWAFFVALSTLYTKQHYVLDVIAGGLLAYVAYRLFVRSYSRDVIPEDERRLAPLLALGAVCVYLLALAFFWAGYLISSAA